MKRRTQEEFNKECKECIEDWRKFDPCADFRKMCTNYCKKGRRAHEEGMKNSINEKRWGRQTDDTSYQMRQYDRNGD